MTINELFHSPLSWITLTILIFWAATFIYRKTRISLLNPMLVTIAALIGILMATSTPYETYYKGGTLIEFWLKPAIVALALPLYQELKHIRSQFATIFITEFMGSLIGIVSVVLIALWLGASPEVVRSLAPKSVSTPIAIEISRQLGGIPALTSAIVVVVGMLGSVAGLKTMQWGRVRGGVSLSLGMGTAAHVMGTNRISDYSDRYGAYATLGLILNGILTAILANPVVALLL